MWKMAPSRRVLVSSVVRGANQGDSHGGLFLVDLERETFEQLLDWNDGSINFEGRGADARVQVRFRDAGVKWLALEYAKLSAA